MIQTSLFLEHESTKKSKAKTRIQIPNFQISPCPKCGHETRDSRARAAQGTCERRREGDGEKVSEERRGEEENTHSLD